MIGVPDSSGSSLMKNLKGKYLLNVASEEFIEFVLFKELLESLKIYVLTEREKAASWKVDNYTDRAALKKTLQEFRV